MIADITVNSKEEVSWVIARGRPSTGPAVEFARACKKAREYIPEGEVAVKLCAIEDEQAFSNNFNGRVYTFLPLSEEVLIEFSSPM